MANKIQVDIIGAGISGLATAYYLSQVSDRFKVRVWEKDSAAGGLAGTFEVEGTRLEKFYHHIYKRDVALQDLIKELGLWGDFAWKESSVGSYYFQQPFRLSTPLDLLKFKPLKMADRLRFVFLLLRSKFIRNWQQLDDRSAKDFIVQYAGENVYRTVWEPLLRGKFGRYADQVSAAWLWCKLVDRGSRNSKGFEELGFLKGGLSRIFDEIIARLNRKGHEVLFNSSVEKLGTDPQGRINAIVVNGKRFETDLVICCTQLPGMLELLPEGSNDYRAALAKIDFLANVCLVLVLDKPLADFYWNNIMDPSSPFVGVIEHTQWTGAQEYKNKHLAYISAYVSPDDQRLKMSGDQLLEQYFPFIQKIFPEFKKSDVVKTFLWSARHTQPVVQVGYRKLRPQIQTPFDNLLLCTMAQIYPQDRQVSNGVEMAQRTVKLIIEKTGMKP